MSGWSLALLQFEGSTWLSLGLGGGIGVFYIASSLLITRLAARFETRRFMLIVVSGVMARLAVALIAVVLVLQLLPVKELPFIGAFLATFTLGLAAEVGWVHRRPLPGDRSFDDTNA